jgi:transcriptional regulator GlxA family with amidase domain
MANLTQTSLRSDRCLENAITLMEKSYAKKLTLEAISRAAGMSPHGLSKLLVKHTGLSPINYLNALRLHHASRLLKQTNLSIEAIAEQCGFANRFYMTRLMKKHRHTTPAAFRANA